MRQAAKPTLLQWSRLPISEVKATNFVDFYKFSPKDNNYSNRIDQYIDELRRFTHGRLIDLCEKIESNSSYKRRSRPSDSVIAGLVVAARSKNMSNGGKMGFATLDDRSYQIDAIVAPELYEQYRHLIQKDQLLVISGELGKDDFSGGYRLRAKEVYDIDAARQRFARQLCVHVDQRVFSNGFLDAFQQTLGPHKGGCCDIVISYANNQALARLNLGEEWRVAPSGELLEQIDQLHEQCSAELVY